MGPFFTIHGHIHKDISEIHGHSFFAWGDLLVLLGIHLVNLIVSTVFLSISSEFFTNDGHNTLEFSNFFANLFCFHESWAKRALSTGITGKTTGSMGITGDATGCKGNST